VGKKAYLSGKRQGLRRLLHEDKQLVNMIVHLLVSACLLLPSVTFADVRSGQQINSDFPVNKPWLDVTTSSISPDMFREDADGATKFAGAAKINREGHFTVICRGVVDNNLIPGTYDPFDRVCVVDRNGEQRLESFQVLPNTLAGGQTWWFDATGNKVPAHPLFAGFEDNVPLFICRIKVNGHHWLIGKFNAAQGACWVTMDGKPVTKTVYAILNVPKPVFDASAETATRTSRSPAALINWPVLKDMIRRGEFGANDVDLLGLAAGVDLHVEGVIRSDDSIDEVKLQHVLAPKLKDKQVMETLTRRAKNNPKLRKIMDLNARVAG
jgi:hypothetical protein